LFLFDEATKAQTRA